MYVHRNSRLAGREGDRFAGHPARNSSIRASQYAHSFVASLSLFIHLTLLMKFLKFYIILHFTLL